MPGRYNWRVPTAKREEILQTARREKLSGSQVAKRFGISAHTYYSWRSPARAIHVKSKSEAIARANGHVPVQETAMAKRNKRGQRYTAAQKRRILAAAKKENLTGDQVRKRFGVSTLTFYRWRGPVRGRRGAVGRRADGGVVGSGQIESAIRARVQQVLPSIIREQVDSYLTEILGVRRRGRPRRR